MPFISVEILRGRTTDQLRGFARAATEAAVAHLSTEASRVRVRFDELEPHQIARSGVLATDEPAAYFRPHTSKEGEVPCL